MMATTTSSSVKLIPAVGLLQPTILASRQRDEHVSPASRLILGVWAVEVKRVRAGTSSEGRCTGQMGSDFRHQLRLRLTPAPDRL